MVQKDTKEEGLSGGSNRRGGGGSDIMREGPSGLMGEVRRGVVRKSIGRWRCSRRIGTRQREFPLEWRTESME